MNCAIFLWEFEPIDSRFQVVVYHKTYFDKCFIEPTLKMHWCEFLGSDISSNSFESKDLFLDHHVHGSQCIGCNDDIAATSNAGPAYAELELGFLRFHRCVLLEGKGFAGLPFLTLFKHNLGKRSKRLLFSRVLCLLYQMRWGFYSILGRRWHGNCQITRAISLRLAAINCHQTLLLKQGSECEKAVLLCFPSKTTKTLFFKYSLYQTHVYMQVQRNYGDL